MTGPDHKRSWHEKRAQVRCRIYKRLRERGWTLQEIADIWGITRQAVNHVLRVAGFRVRVMAEERFIMGRIMSRLWAKPYHLSHRAIARIWQIPRETVRRRIEGVRAER